jgi:hypothetical protein
MAFHTPVISMACFEMGDSKLEVTGNPVSLQRPLPSDVITSGLPTNRDITRR